MHETGTIKHEAGMLISGAMLVAMAGLLCAARIVCSHMAKTQSEALRSEDVHAHGYSIEPLRSCDHSDRSLHTALTSSRGII